MSNIRTLTDIQQDEHSVQSIHLRGTTTEDVSVQTTILAPRPVLNDDLREIARERLNNNDLRLPPIRTNANGIPVEDAQDIRNLNENLDEETLRSTLEAILEIDSSILRNIISNMSEENQERMRNILGQPNYDLMSLTPILNTIIYANVGFYDYHSSTTNLANLLTELNSPENLFENNLEEIEEEMDRNIREANNNSEERNEAYSRARSNILSSVNWQTILRRGGALLVTGFATYMGAPYMGALGNLGMRFLENAPNLSSSMFSTGTDLVSRNPTSRITWDDVSGSFWNSWSLFAQYMGRRSG